MTDTPGVALLRRAYAAGINPMVATDVEAYVSMTLTEIAEEWDKDVIEILAALDFCFPSYPADSANERRSGESFSEFIKRLLSVRTL